MKKPVILLLLLFLYLHSTAQNGHDKHYYLGINSGVNLSRLTIDPSIMGMFDFTTDQKFINGYSGGIVFIYYSEPHLGVQMELNYSQRGWTENMEANYYSRNLEYLEFPILSHFDIGKKKLNLTITVGPTISYLLSGREQTNITDENLIKSYYNSDVDNKLEAGVCMGLGVSKKFTRMGIIQFECRFNQGLTNIFLEKDNPDILASQNQVIGIKMSYLFGW